MKKIIESILCCDLDNEAGIWHPLPILPASASFSSESAVDGSGRLRTVKLSFKLTRDIQYLRRNLSMVISFDDGTKELIGTSSIPARLTISKDDVLRCSCTWKMPE